MTHCARCSTPHPDCTFRGVLAVCESCWVELEVWASDYETAIRAMVASSTRMRAATRAKDLGGEVIDDLLKAVG